jgi:hypothetical protein
MNEQLNTPPGAAEVYSDLSFITLEMVVGTIALRQRLVTRDTFLPQCLAGRGGGDGVYGNTSTSSKKPQEKGQRQRQGQGQGEEEYDPVSIVCAFEAFVRQEVFDRPVGEGGEPWLESSSYLPPPELYPLCAPTMDDTGGWEGGREGGRVLCGVGCALWCGVVYECSLLLLMNGME